MIKLLSITQIASRPASLRNRRLKARPQCELQPMPVRCYTSWPELNFVPTEALVGIDAGLWFEQSLNTALDRCQLSQENLGGKPC